MCGDYCTDIACPYSDWPQQISRYLLESMPSKNIEEKFSVFKRRRVSAEVHDDERRLEVDFDATEWFEQASDLELVKLQAIDWSGDYQADAVAEYFDGKNDDISRFFKRKQELGFECSVDADEAMEWLRINRVALWSQILCAENNVDTIESSDRETPGHWDWKQGPEGCEYSLPTREEAMLDAVMAVGLGQVPQKHFKRCSAKTSNSVAKTTQRDARATIGSALTMIVPEAFSDPAFMQWLNNGTPKMTWHQGGPATNLSDVVVLVDPSLSGEGTDSDMPEHIWNSIVEACRQNFKPAHASHIMVRLTNCA